MPEANNEVFPVLPLTYHRVQIYMDDFGGFSDERYDEVYKGRENIKH
ncbi:MAG: hypothetical protein N2745_11740 [Syntrophorhabdaceae bacterium]|nr:hypothetical protein [Syntrophorhabdaceae bacterium]